MTSPALLSVTNLAKRYGAIEDHRQVIAFDHVSFRLGYGDIVAILGPSGCGKSTLLKVVAGLEQPTSGDVSLEGARLRGPHAQVGIVFQEDRLLPWLTVRENIDFSRRFAANRLSPPTDTTRHETEAILSRLGLREFGDAYPGEISGGMAQRVALARALLRRPRLLLFDEPFAALDAFNRMEMQDWVVSLLKERGTSALFVTHDIDEALYVGDRIMMMTPRPGRVAGIVDNPVPLARRREDERLIMLRQDIMSRLVGQGAMSSVKGVMSRELVDTTGVS